MRERGRYDIDLPCLHVGRFLFRGWSTHDQKRHADFGDRVPPPCPATVSRSLAAMISTDDRQPVLISKMNFAMMVQFRQRL